MSAPTPLDAWLAGKPESVRKLAAEFPPPHVFKFDNGFFSLVGYTDENQLILAPTAVCDDREAMIAAHILVPVEQMHKWLSRQN